MTLQELDYRFRPRTPKAPETKPQTMTEEMRRKIHVLGDGKTPNRKSIAKKKWWDEKRAREATGDK